MKPSSFTAAIIGSCLALSAAKSLWSKSPATYGSRDSDAYLLKTGYPVGNGKLGVIPFGEPGLEKWNINVDSLWSGGPFESSDYTGGNPADPKYSALPEIRAAIFKNGTGDVSPLLGSGTHYGSNRVLGNLTITIPDLKSYNAYNRSLDLSTGIHTTEFTSASARFTTSVLCSYPDQICVYHIQSNNTAASLPTLTVGFENLLVAHDLITTTCGNDWIALTGHTQAGSLGGMKYVSVARSVGSIAKTSCSSSSSGNALIIQPGEGQTSHTIVVGAGTDYDQKKGNRANNYTFQGSDPTPLIHALVGDASGKNYEDILAAHLKDYQALENTFHLSLPDPHHSSSVETAVLLSRYNWTDTTGDPFVESLLFDYSRHLLISSSRANSLPANLQGRWTERLESAWGADYHANINMQMNYWGAEQTGLGGATIMDALWDYMIDTWVPRGGETAKLLYGAEEGWVVHNEMNIFGHTAMKEAAQWADYPAAAAWMMQHVWDHYDYSRDISFLRSKGYPLLKGVASFWLSQLQNDTFSADNTLVVNPCNSPETGPTTFGCAHYQQLIHQVFDNVLSAAAAAATNQTDDDREREFVEDVRRSLERLDKGFHVSTWGGVKEWKLPDSYGFDGPSLHRHLSHLVGWYPGYSLSSYLLSSKNNTSSPAPATLLLQAAVRQTLLSRGLGNAGGDANAGWEKVWRGACWARLHDSARAHEELRLAVDVNFAAANGLSMYDALSPPFQIDANFGLAGAVLSMLVVDLPLPFSSSSSSHFREVVLGPAIPAAWGGGSVSGLRIRGRGGVQVGFKWDESGLVTEAAPIVKASETIGRRETIVFVNVRGDKLAEI
ncbi:glycoside hydrolase family 95 protein [Xylariaceae sp. FL0594]|nr:glycoside hydrolase family 95 protein [Xylariaceae sp. FL0594]